MLKPKSVLLYIFIMVLFILLFASFDAEPYFEYAAYMDVTDSGMYRALTDNMSGLRPEEPAGGDDQPGYVAEYVLNDESSVIRSYKFILYYLDYAEYPTNGIFDSDLLEALRRYQTERLLDVSGILDKATMESLDSEVLTYSEGKYGDAILYYKDRLQELGYYPQNAVLTDGFDEEMTDIIKKYQKNNGLAQNGTLDVDTQVCLRKPLENQADVDGKVQNPDATVVTTDEGRSRGN
ncbi:MAG: peptidoglycan-binding protein [Eubacteriaceae bacterium]|nr:peptidoglycan-binding protein [Eubacteriaceae bacterium]